MQHWVESISKIHLNYSSRPELILIMIHQSVGLWVAGSDDLICMYFSVELNVEAREKSGELYCLRCHDKMGIPICGACRSVQLFTL